MGVNEHDGLDGQALLATSGNVVPTLPVGTEVCVQNRFLGDWTTGFKVAEVVDDGYRIQRLSDGHVFPDVFGFEEVRLERRQQPLREVAGSHLDRRH